MKWYPQSVNQKKSEKLRSLITGRSWWKWLSAPQIWRVTMWILWFVWHEIAPRPQPRAHKAVVLCSVPPSQRAAMAFKSTHLFPSVVGTNRSLSAQSQRGTRLQEGGRWWPMGTKKQILRGRAAFLSASFPSFPLSLVLVPGVLASQACVLRVSDSLFNQHWYLGIIC